ncbi:hypothetical protein A2276_08050 [candidate division WOR-1 bacterium RIFOXYA12_FULL_43_27]|uniref:Uncharacterized protein n=1 Tax=candidate division WOR-1 bacterium RIFOXYC2_FULL_46_14 TaxID=1802587 RepID=A0A1F4U6E2_UNCSA|nr:MAG: hypothetical protein A2276_08050 [candidate division WOR-1 bacterium RIFOXYA12_FULL_43_27]OGC20548.1 MAG: hypothetical protein A2292_05875 [candidate division WOR-1 bacterium RIFOXYB2_FULL_46_45]OGC31715.1 MAG: hypothetical protein A2232_05575 [candidate division WOR-1 bacterium RIFOXYA2_FULL_46_56]OGC40390.1 MAG: hypothetical protein A2438_03905 [candidate division WOR-1 bacterium RIFOXYC2_FULL_46_14]
MGNVIDVTGSGTPKAIRSYLAKGDKDYSGKLETQEEVNLAVASACSGKGEACASVKKYVESMGWQVKVEKVSEAKSEKLNETPIKGYFYTTNGVKFRAKGEGKWRIFGESKWGGFGVDNGDSEGKTQWHIPSKTMKYVAFEIKNPSEGKFALPRFKVEINGNEAEWIDADTKGTVKVAVDSEMFPKGKLLKFQLIFAEGTLNIQLENPRALSK